ncbi:MAG: AAA family ATPase [Candidatus Heimdallarchaeota archaeon]
MIEKIMIHGFKSINIAKLDLAKINLFIGENNAGKSTILHSFAFISQSLHLEPEYEGIVDLNSFKDTIFKKKAKSQILFEIQPKIDLDNYLFDEELRKHGKTITWSLTISEMGVEKQSITSPFGHEFFSFERGKQISYPLLSRIDAQYFKATGGKSSSIGGSNVEVLNMEYNVRSRDGLSPATVVFQKIKDNLFHTFQNTYFLPITRGILRWNYHIDAAMPSRVMAGDEGHSATNILFFMIHSRYEDEWGEISKWAEKFGISSLKSYPRDVSSNRAVRAKQKIPICGLESFDENLSIHVEVAAKGFGSRQVLPIIVQSVISPPGSIILVEEPEIHLHPKLQGEIVEFFADSIQKDRQFLITTHSEHIIARLQTLIASGKLSAEDVRVFEVSKEPQGTKIQQVQIAEDGGMEIPTFFDVNKEEMTRFLEALKEKKE